MRPMPLPPPQWRPRFTIFSALRDVAIWCFPSPMLHRVSMPVLISRGGSASSSCATSAGSWEREGVCLHTLTHARCRNSGRCLMLQWGCRYPCRSTSPVLQNICSTEDSWPPMTRGSGVLLATVKQMSLRCWGPSILRRVNGSIIW